MEVKKSGKADLENKKFLFFEIGLLLVFTILIVAFEWTSKPDYTETIGQIESLQMDEEIVPVTRQPQMPVTPPPPLVIEQLNIVNDDVEIDETDFESMEADEKMSVDFIPYASNEEASVNEEVFFIVEDMPKFNGGDKEEFRKYITENLHFPEAARVNGVDGRVFVQFAVNAKGEVCDVVVLKGADPALEKEIIRVIKSSPKWTPGKQRGRPVKVQFNFPIVFLLN